MPSADGSAACWEVRGAPLLGSFTWPGRKGVEEQAHRGGHEHTAAVRASGRAAARPTRPIRAGAGPKVAGAGPAKH